jgi:hypothetical protein
MDFDANAIAQGAGAFKTIFDGLRSAIGLVRDIRGSGKASEEQEKLVEEALEKATAATKIAEAQLAKALGYELCKCQYPPVPMLTVGVLTRGPKAGSPVYECPQCGHNTATPYDFTRTARRDASA